MKRASLCAYSVQLILGLLVPFQTIQSQQLSVIAEFQTGRYDELAYAGNLDDDTQLELVMWEFGESGYAVFDGMTGELQFSSTIFPSYRVKTLEDLVDVNQDGKLDLLEYDSSDGVLRVVGLLGGGVNTEGRPTTWTRSGELHDNYPEPFNVTTNIEYELVAPERTVIEIFDLHGRRVSTLVDEIQQPGSHTVEWDAKSADGTDLPSGLYLYRLRVGAYVSSKTAIYIK